MHEVVAAEALDAKVAEIVAALVANGPAAVRACKRLVQDVAGREIDAALRDETARRIADIRASAEGREGVQAFLNKRDPAWKLDLNLTQLVALAAALGWASGLRLYAVVFITGAIGWLGWVTLPDGLSLLQHPVVLGASFLMFLVEFVADKIPGLDSLWDAVHTFIRIPAGAALAAGVFGGDSASLDAGGGAGRRHAGGHRAHRQGHHARGGEYLARAVLQHRPVAGG